MPGIQKWKEEEIWHILDLKRAQKPGKEIRRSFNRKFPKHQVTDSSFAYIMSHYGSQDQYAPEYSAPFHRMVKERELRSQQEAMMGPHKRWAMQHQPTQFLGDMASSSRAPLGGVSALPQANNGYGQIHQGTLNNPQPLNTLISSLQTPQAGNPFPNPYSAQEISQEAFQSAHGLPGPYVFGSQPVPSTSFYAPPPQQYYDQSVLDHQSSIQSQSQSTRQNARPVSSVPNRNGIAKKGRLPAPTSIHRSNAKYTGFRNKDIKAANDPAATPAPTQQPRQPAQMSQNSQSRSPPRGRGSTPMLQQWAAPQPQIQTQQGQTGQVAQQNIAFSQLPQQWVTPQPQFQAPQEQQGLQNSTPNPHYQQWATSQPQIQGQQGQLEQLGQQSTTFDQHQQYFASPHPQLQRLQTPTLNQFQQQFVPPHPEFQAQLGQQFLSPYPQDPGQQGQQSFMLNQHQQQWASPQLQIQGLQGQVAQIGQQPPAPMLQPFPFPHPQTQANNHHPTPRTLTLLSPTFHTPFIVPSPSSGWLLTGAPPLASPSTGPSTTTTFTNLDAGTIVVISKPVFRAGIVFPSSNLPLEKGDSGEGSEEGLFVVDLGDQTVMGENLGEEENVSGERGGSGEEGVMGELFGVDGEGAEEKEARRKEREELEFGDFVNNWDYVAK